MKYREPVKGKGFRNMFRKSGYKVYLVDEFRTSCKCSHCECEDGICEKKKWIENPKPYKNNSQWCHGLLTCKRCSGVWNRDENSSRNIFKLIRNCFLGNDRPEYLKREKNSIL